MMWGVFGIMLLAGSLVIAWPMIQSERRVGLRPVSAIVAIVFISVAVYAKTGSPDAASASGELPDIDAMVAGLARRLEESPEDLAGWKMLGRSYMELRRYGEAVRAFEQALEREDGSNGQTLADLGEAVLLESGGGVTGRAAELFESAVAAAPGNPKALFYGGIAAIERGDRERAASRWEALLATSPPPEVRTVLQQRIAEWRGDAQPTTPVPAPDEGDAIATVSVSLGDAAAAAVPGEATVFIIARDPGSPSPPIAAVRRRVSELPATVTLSDADAMIPGRALSAFQQLEIVARVSMSGGPIEQPGDWYGTAALDTRQSRKADIVIDRIVE